MVNDTRVKLAAHEFNELLTPLFTRAAVLGIMERGGIPRLTSKFAGILENYLSGDSVVVSAAAIMAINDYLDKKNATLEPGEKGALVLLVTFFIYERLASYDEEERH